MKQIDPWALLQVRPGDDATKLKAAYKAMMLIAHPDRGGSNEAASDVTRAYEFLKTHLVEGKVPHPTQAGLAMPVQAPVPQYHRVVHVVVQSPWGSSHASTTTTSTTGCWTFVSWR